MTPLKSHSYVAAAAPCPPYKDMTPPPQTADVAAVTHDSSPQVLKEFRDMLLTSFR